MSFSTWLFKWKEFIPYITIDILEEPERTNYLLETLGELTRFYHFELIPSKPVMPIIPLFNSLNTTKETTLLSRKHFFLQWRIFRKGVKAHQNSLTFLDDLVE